MSEKNVPEEQIDDTPSPKTMEYISRLILNIINDGKGKEKGIFLVIESEDRYSFSTNIPLQRVVDFLEEQIGYLEEALLDDEEQTY